tara:strand:- start:143 stop:628 length:486 start_codon:yes stop_codon:yes gene_type:complete
MWLLLLFILIPLLEIWLFILLGGFIGVYLTLFVILLTAILGTFLVKTQGINVLKEIQSKFNELENPTEPIVHGAMILFAGALLLTPGFFTDTVGFLLLLPKVRKAAFFWLKNKVNLVKHSSSEIGGGDKNKYSDIEVTDYKEVEPEEKSPWTNNSKTHNSD